MRVTRFRGVDGTIYIIPNGDIRLVGNLSRGWARAVVDLALPGRQRGRPGGGARVIVEAAHGVAHEPRVRRPRTEPPTRRRAASRGRRDDHDAGHAAHRAVAARRADPGPARGDVRRRWPRRSSWPADARRRPPRARLNRTATARIGLAAGARPPRPPATWPRPGRRVPVHRASCAAAWWTSMPSPSTTVAPAPGRLDQPGRRPGRVDQVGRHLAGAEQVAGPPATGRPRRRPRHPDRRGVDHQVGEPTASATARLASRHRPAPRPGQAPPPSRPARACGSRPRPRRPRAGQGEHDGPGRAAGADDEAPLARRRRRRRPGPARPRTRRRRCWSPRRTPSGGRRSSPRRAGAATSLHSSTRAATSALCGIVTDSPLRSARRMAASASAACPGGTSKAKERQVPPSPRAAKAALCSSGESEWATGLPMTPTSRVAAGTRPRPVHGQGAATRQRLRGAHGTWPAARWPAARRRCRRTPSTPFFCTSTKYSQPPAGGCTAASSASGDGMQIGVGVRPVLR